MKFYKLSTALCIFLGACAPEVADWTPSESPKKNVVDRAILSHTIHYPAHSSSFEGRERRALHQFLTAHVQKPSSVTIILQEYGRHSEKRIKDVERELVIFGVPFHLITVEYEEAPQHKPKKHHKIHKQQTGSGIEMTVERYVVIPPSCGDFSRSIGDADQAYNHSNYGCSDTANLGMMVANPRDLINGRTLSPADGTVIAAGVQRYRKDNVKALLESATNVAPGQSSGQSQTPSTPGSGITSGGAY